MLTNSQLDTYIQTFTQQSSRFEAELADTADKKERAVVFKRHGYLERVIKLFYLLKTYDDI